MKRNQTLAVLGTLAVIAFAGPAQADRASDPAYLDEIDSCVAEVKRRLDVADVQRLRHIVTDSKRSALGYALTIRTSVWDGDRENSYKTYCVANGNNTPIKFRFEQTSL